MRRVDNGIKVIIPPAAPLLFPSSFLPLTKKGSLIIKSALNTPGVDDSCLHVVVQTIDGLGILNSGSRWRLVLLVLLQDHPVRHRLLLLTIIRL